MKYTIGEFAELLGVTKDTLRVYEKHGIIKPLKDYKNNYRYFTDLDCRNILMSRWYRSLDIPLKETSELTINSTLNQITEKVTERSSLLEKEINRSIMLLGKINEIKDEILNIEADLKLCTEKMRHGLYRIKQTNGNILIANDYLKPTINRWMQLLPYTFYSYQIDKDAFISDSCKFLCNWGLAINEKDFLSFALQTNKAIEYIPPGKCIHSVILIDNEDDFSRNSLKFMIDYVSDNKYVIAGDISGKIILTERDDNGNSHSYIDVNIPIQ